MLNSYKLVKYTGGIHAYTLAGLHHSKYSGDDRSRGVQDQQPAASSGAQVRVQLLSLLPGAITSIKRSSCHN